MVVKTCQRACHRMKAALYRCWNMSGTFEASRFRQTATFRTKSTKTNLCYRVWSKFSWNMGLGGMMQTRIALKGKGAHRQHPKSREGEPRWQNTLKTSMKVLMRASQNFNTEIISRRTEQFALLTNILLTLFDSHFKNSNLAQYYISHRPAAPISLYMYIKHEGGRK